MDNSGSTTVTMTTGVDPGQFPTMEITAESPGTGALQGAVLLACQNAQPPATMAGHVQAWSRRLSGRPGRPAFRMT